MAKKAKAKKSGSGKKPGYRKPGVKPLSDQELDGVSGGVGQLCCGGSRAAKSCSSGRTPAPVPVDCSSGSWVTESCSAGGTARSGNCGAGGAALQSCRGGTAH